MIKTPIHDFLVNYNKKARVRCHMPGNKGLEFPHDITEIAGADSLYESDGIIAESERTAARLFGAEKTLYSCSGSTLAIQAMLTLIKTVSGGTVLAANRSVHRSFVSACALLDFDVDWIYGEDEVINAIKPDTAAVFINSTDYYGKKYDVRKIAEICDEIPLLVDNAHGAYLTFLGTHPITQGAAMTADSAHKTLPALTGAAYLHINDKRFVPDAKAAAALFGTSSPSYLILESLDLCNKHIAEGNIKAFELIADLKNNLARAGFPLRESDPLRITADSRECGYSGFDFAAELRNNNIECEFADENCTVLLFSTITAKAETDEVFAAFMKIKQKKPLKPIVYPVLKLEKNISIREAVFAHNCAVLHLEEAAGKVCAEIIAPCPPGIPVVMPGEIISAEAVELLKGFGVDKIKITEVEKK
ncbi:MAG: DegT/DnrJ/EryC1/StrS family aminotransferase [Oscillospiraceae bacterium]|jgi:arginine/lysine/ornithine decarboxylase|nr:DegT/DnrJ/EryC1/StrS family aminotransferase [Oscillospiraceae bacterium]